MAATTSRVQKVSLSEDEEEEEAEKRAEDTSSAAESSSETEAEAVGVLAASGTPDPCRVRPPTVPAAGSSKKSGEAVGVSEESGIPALGRPPTAPAEEQKEGDTVPPGDDQRKNTGLTTKKNSGCYRTTARHPDDVHAANREAKISGKLWKDFNYIERHFSRSCLGTYNI